MNPINAAVAAFCLCVFVYQLVVYAKTNSGVVGVLSLINAALMALNIWAGLL